MLWIRNNRRYGYIVDGSFYTSKVLALQAAGGDINRLRLYFNDDDWSNLDYTKEPKQSWTELIDLRVKQIRDQYDYVALFFSGGYDSTTILNAFLRNNLLIDELIIWEREWLPETQIETKNAFETATYIKNSIWPNLKITYHIKTVKSLSKFYKDLKVNSNWLEHPGCHLGMQKNIRDWEFENAETMIYGMHERPNSIMIEGREKPRLDFRDGKWYAMMNDKLLTYCMGNTCDQFYFSGDCPEIYLKNCYMFIDWLETNYDVTHELVHQMQDSSKMSKELYEEYNLALGRDPVILLSHRYGLNKIYNSGGMIKQLDSVKLKDAILEQDPEVHKIWQSGMEEVTTTWKSAMQEDGTDFKTVVSTIHYIKDYEPWKRKIKTNLQV